MITKESLKLFIAYAQDAGNWSGYPYVSEGNIFPTKAQRGNLSDLAQKGLIEITDEWTPGINYIVFTEAGKALAAANGVDLSWID
jgi:hypothetical protein